MNLFGVLKYKKMAEDFVRNSGIPFTIIRAGEINRWALHFL
uniref:NAD(P)-binding domain-containing protein n=1 Tax=Aegilops tauschii subsp. strangulata TaxID=200361 RepID=A0A453HPY9_AEGTS